MPINGKSTIKETFEAPGLCSAVGVNGTLIWAPAGVEPGSLHSESLLFQSPKCALGQGFSALVFCGVPVLCFRLAPVSALLCAQS